MRRSLLRRLGLQADEPPPDPEAWVAVGSFPADGESGSSTDAARAVATLADAGIDARQRTYLVPDKESWSVQRIASTADRIRVAVLVRERDRKRAASLVPSDETPPVSEEELIRASEEAAPSPDADQPPDH